MLITEQVKKKQKQAKPKKGSIDLTFLILVLLLLVIGLVMLFSASYAYAYYNAPGHNSFYYISRQLVFAILGVGVMGFVSMVDYHLLHKFAIPIFLGSLVLLVAVLIIPSREDARRWIDLGFATFQPSEIAKFAIILLRCV